MSKYYEYKNEKFLCSKCGWTGKGTHTEQGELFGELFELDCPSCHEVVGIVSFPTFAEDLKYGTDEDKEKVRKRIAFEKRMTNSKLKSIKQLPKIEGDNLIFVNTTEWVNDDLHLKIFCNSELIWKEIVGYEYYTRYIELGKMFKRKYKSRMIDFIPEESQYLDGDSITAFKKIEDFRGSLKPNTSQS
jgi:hypothetical protein